MSSSRMSRKGDATVKEVADYLGHHPETIRIMARSGDFPNAYKGWPWPAEQSVADPLV